MAGPGRHHTKETHKSKSLTREGDDMCLEPIAKFAAQTNNKRYVLDFTSIVLAATITIATTNQSGKAS